MIQLDNIIEILTLSNFDTLVFVGVVLFYGCGIGATFIDAEILMGYAAILRNSL